MSRGLKAGIAKGGKTNRAPRSQDSRGARMAQHAAGSVLARHRRRDGLELETSLFDVRVVEPR